MPAGRPPKYKTPEEMQRIIDLYFLACKVRMTGNTDLLEDLPEDDLLIVNDIEGSMPTVSGLSYTLGLTRQGLIEYNGKHEFSDTVKDAKQRIEMFLEERLYHTGCTGTIFNLKNNYGWKDKQDIEMSGELNHKDMTDEQLKEEAERLISDMGYVKKEG
jgi:hypothetical protein